MLVPLKNLSLNCWQVDFMQTSLSIAGPVACAEYSLLTYWHVPLRTELLADRRVGGAVAHVMNSSLTSDMHIACIQNTLPTSGLVKCAEYFSLIC